MTLWRPGTPGLGSTDSRDLKAEGILASWHESAGGTVEGPARPETDGSLNSEVPHQPRDASTRL